MWTLFKLRRDARERGIELAAQSIDYGDDRDRDASGNQAVFDGGSPRLVFQKRDYFRHHSTLLRVSPSRDQPSAHIVP
jgi:hypothetical protein